jgi:membrane-bound lytic murein transglycosylase D
MIRQVSILFLLLHFHFSFAQFPRDTVYFVAFKAVNSTRYPAMALIPKGPFPLSDAFSMSKTQEWVQSQKIHFGGLSASLALGNNYFPEIERKLKEANLPDTYKWIPLVMSGMVHDFRGPGGRAGLWQVPHLVALRYGLVLAPGFDERMDPSKNTDAALRWLTHLHQEFGTMDQALLAFFNGEGALRHALARMQTVRLPDAAAVQAFLYTHLPPATRDDIYRWNAATATFTLMPETSRHKHPLVTVGATAPVVVEKNMEVKALAEVMKIPIASLRTANPSLLGEVFPAGASIHLPVDATPVFAERQGKIFAYQDSIASLPKKKIVPVTPAMVVPANADKITYTVRSGDNLGQIALRHGVGLSQLKAWNSLSSDRIYAGQKLTIYGHANPNFKVEEKTPPTPARVTTSDGTFIQYVVKQGDTLWSISRQFEGVSVEDIQRWNNIGDRIDIGQILKIKKP